MLGFTTYVAIGALVSLVVFLLLFTKWPLPKKLKNRFKLNTKMKMLLFVVVMGVVLAVFATIIAVLLGVPQIWIEVIQGLGVGFSCAVVVGLLDTIDPAGPAQGRQAKKRASPDIRGRRSKG